MKTQSIIFRVSVIICAVALAASSCCGGGEGGGIPANKKAVMDAFVAGTLDPSYVPAAFFAHFPGPKEGEGAVRSHLDFYLRGNADILKVQFEQRVPAIEGFYMTCQGGEMKYYDIPGFFDNFVRPFDLDVMNFCMEDTKMNILHICDWEGAYDDLTRYADYPGQIVNTPIDLNGVAFGLNDAVKLFGGRHVLGGLERKGIILSGSPSEVASAASAAIASGPRGLMMLGAECTVSDAPMANIHAAISTAHHGGAASY